MTKEKLIEELQKIDEEMERLSANNNQSSFYIDEEMDQLYNEYTRLNFELENWEE